jgi:pilus assembly protein CpaB
VHRNNLVILFVAIVMGGVAALLAYNWLQARTSATSTTATIGTVVVAGEPLAFGATLTADNIAEIPWAAKTLPEGSFTSKDEVLHDGRRVVLSPLERNEPILRSKVTGPGQRASLSSLLQNGKRAVTVRVDDVRGVAGFILPGDFVDVVLIGEDAPPRRENYSEILLQQVRVLAVDQLASERQEQPTVVKAVTIEVTPEQAQKVLLATNIGKLSLILRRPAETESDATHRVTERDLGQGGLTRAVPPPPPPPPAPPVVVQQAAPPSNTVKVGIVRNMKREDYVVTRRD